jgi:hypothetical protein
MVSILAMAKNYWLAKSEPEAYSWDDLVKDGKTVWTGVRNFQARNNLRAMKAGDFVLFYHSVTDKQVVGIAKVAKEFYPDPTAEEGDWSVVDQNGRRAERHGAGAAIPALGHTVDRGAVQAPAGTGRDEGVSSRSWPG